MIFPNKQFYGSILCGLFIFFGFGISFAQKTESNDKTLKEFAKSYQKESDQAREKAFSVARKKNWVTFKEFKNGRVMSLQSIDKSGMPIYLVTDNNSYAAATTRVNRLYTNGGLGLNLSGSSNSLLNKIGIWDGGSIYSEHQEFAGERILNKNTGAAVSRHATHVAGTMMAAGINTSAKGMAFELPRLVGYDFNNDESEMALEASNMLISNHSYGFIAGWYYNDTPSGGGAARWEWYGTSGTAEDYKFGFYDNDTRRWDEISYQAPYYLPVKSSGNNRNETGPADGGTYYHFTNNTWTEATRVAGEISSNNGYDIISLTGNAKNSLTVGAITGLPNGPFTPSSIQISSFSSWGPTDDGRIKPDLVGMGVALNSTVNTSTTAYASLSGTSMASPNVSGSLILLQEAYNQKYSGAFMRSASLKGLALHTADDAGNAGPDYIYGWGLLNAEKAAQLIQNDGNKSNIIEDELLQGAGKTLQLISSGTGPLIATICWTDPPGLVNTATAIDERTPRLVNDLDMRINGETYKPWVLDPEQPALAATTGDNFRDNVEQIIISDPIPGKTYTLTISHKGTTLTGNKQNFSLILSGVGGVAYCTSAPTSTADAKITSFSLANITYTATNGTCTGYIDNTGQLIELEAGGTYPLNLKLGTCGADAPKMAKVYIDFNGDGVFDESTELLSTSPVISGNGEYTDNLNIPNNVTIDNFSLLRIVMSETSTASSINACGSYARGETQDYRVKLIRASKDVGISALVDPISGACSNNLQKVTVKIKNYGSVGISNIPVSITITQNGNTVATLNQTYTGTINALSEANFTLIQTFNAQAGINYQINASTGLSDDLDASNNENVTSITVSNPPTLSNTSAIQCGSSNNYTLNATGLGTKFWYKNFADNLPVAFSVNTNSVNYTDNGTTAINTFYAGINDFSGKAGPATNTTFTSGGYLNGNNPAVLMRTAIPIILESARLYIGSGGKVTFVASKTASGEEVSRVTLEVSPGNQIYPLNLILPQAGDYTVSISYEGGASIYRNNGGVSGYPFKIGELFSIIGNTASTTGNSTFADFYYYFYDLSVKSTGCIGSERVAVNTSVTNSPEITVNGNILTSTVASGNQWYFNGTAISGATASTYTSTQPGTYSVKVTAGTCVLSSENILVGVTFPLPYNNFSISTTDETCRANNNGVISITAVKTLSYTATIQINGVPVSYPFTNTLTIPNLAAGSYPVCIVVDGNSSYQVCYTLTIAEPKDLAVLTQVNPVNNSLSLQLNGGSKYQIKLNDEVFTTSASQITLSLKAGDNNLQVKTDKECQGSFDETIYVNEQAIVYPNPFKDFLNIRLGINQTSKVKMVLINSNGLVVYQAEYTNDNGTIQLNLAHLEPGFYFLTIGDQTHKILKK